MNGILPKIALKESFCAHGFNHVFLFDQLRQPEMMYFFTVLPGLVSHSIA